MDEEVPVRDRRKDRRRDIDEIILNIMGIENM
jgi:hypothetical protein